MILKNINFYGNQPLPSFIEQIDEGQ